MIFLSFASSFASSFVGNQTSKRNTYSVYQGLIKLFICKFVCRKSNLQRKCKYLNPNNSIEALSDCVSVRKSYDLRCPTPQGAGHLENS